MTQPAIVPRETAQWGRWTTFIVAFPILFGLMLTWAFATPLMASPDEPAHAMRAASAGMGQPNGADSWDGTGPMQVAVPRYFAEAEEHINCYRRTILVTPACVSPVIDPDTIVIGESTANLNPPFFYSLVGWPAAFLDGAKALYAMRAMVALVCSALLAVAFGATRRLGNSRWATVAVAVATTPMVLFLGGVVNPNGIEACAAIALLCLLVLTFRTRASRSEFIERAALITVSALLLMSTRSVSLIWMLIAVIVALLVAKRDVLLGVVASPATWVSALIIGLSSLWSLWFYTRPQELRLTYTAIGAGSSWQEGFFTTIDRTFEYGFGWIGQFGWLDTQAPALTIVIWSMAAGLLIAGAALRSSIGIRISLALIGLVMILLPAFTQAALVHDVGYVWQGRYTLALFMMLIVTAGIGLDHSAEAGTSGVPPRRYFATGLILLGLGQFAAFFWILKRYVVSLSWDSTWLEMLRGPAWQPPGGWPLVALVMAALLAAGVTAVLASIPVGLRTRRRSLEKTRMLTPAATSPGECQ